MNPTFRVLTLLLSILVASFATAADYPAPTESDFTIHDFKFASGETLPELRVHYRTLGKPEKDAQGKTTNAVLIMHGTTGSGAQIYSSRICRRAIRERSAARCDEVFHRIAGRDRSRQIEQAERRHARQIPTLRLYRHGGGRLSPLNGGTRRRSRATGNGNVYGRNAHLVVGRVTSRFYGRAHAAGEFADPDLWAQPCMASHGHRRDPQRSGMDRWRLQNSTAEPAHRCRDALVYEQQSGPPPKGCSYACESG